MPWLAGLNVLFLIAAIAARVAIQQAEGFGWLGLALFFPEFAFIDAVWPATVWAACNVAAVVTVAAVVGRREPDRRGRLRRAAAGVTVATTIVFGVNAIPALIIVVMGLTGAGR